PRAWPRRGAAQAARRRAHRRAAPQGRARQGGPNPGRRVYALTTRVTRRRALVALAALAVFGLTMCGPAPKHERTPVSPDKTVRPGVQRGLATFYGNEQHGGPT